MVEFLLALCVGILLAFIIALDEMIKDKLHLLEKKQKKQRSLD